MKLAFQFSNWYSGATLLAILLNNNSEITCNGETFPFRYDASRREVFVCSCGKHMKECSFYSNASKAFQHFDGSWNGHFKILPDLSSNLWINRFLLGFNHLVPLRDALIRSVPMYRESLSEYIDAHLDFYAQACAFDNSTCYVDGTKSVRRAELFAKHQSKPLQVIYLIRDGRGFCCSYLKHHGLDSNNLDIGAKAWLEYIDMVDSFHQRYPHVQIHSVRYEDLCSDLEGCLRDICTFLGVRFESSMIGAPASHHLLGNTIRNTFDGAIREDVSWKERFSAVEIETMNRLLGRGLRRFGYL